VSISTENALTYSVVRIEANETKSCGTGFFYKISFGHQGNLTKLYIATNKHVIEGAETISFVITTAPSIEKPNKFGQFDDQKHESINLSLGKGRYFEVVSDTVIRHPNTEIDLALIDVTVPVGQYLATTKLRMVYLDNTWLHSESDRPLRAIETVKVVGYPNGIWDAVNNSPIARTGSTATHPLAKLDGKSNFLVDAAVFGGSSGSPVFAFEAPMYLLPNGGYAPGTKASLVGILWGVVEKNTKGAFVMERIPASMQQSPLIKTSLNLGVAMHAAHLLEIEDIIRGVKGTS
jgi:Trypsin-like peptidase domain